MVMYTVFWYFLFNQSYLILRKIFTFFLECILSTKKLKIDAFNTFVVGLDFIVCHNPLVGPPLNTSASLLHLLPCLSFEPDRLSMVIGQ